MAKKQIVMFHDANIQKWHVRDPTLAFHHPSINKYHTTLINDKNNYLLVIFLVSSL